MKEGLPDYTLIRSSRRTVAIQVLPGARVIVRAPQWISDTQVRQIIARHQDTIRRHMRAMACVPPRVLSVEEISALYAKARTILPAKVNHYAMLLGRNFAGSPSPAQKSALAAAPPRAAFVFPIC